MFPEEAQRVPARWKIHRLAANLVAIATVKENLTGLEPERLVCLRIADQHPFWCVPGLDLLERQDVFHLLPRGLRLDFILRRNQWRVNRGRFGGQGDKE
jgi:hypothetical protein